MTLRDWLRKERGRAAEMADHFGITTSAVSQWANPSGGVPLARMRDVVAFTSGAVRLEDMIPGAPARKRAAKVAA